MKILILLTPLIISFKAYTYPNFVGYGYNSCITCHYNPYGNGVLNDYGRALGATLVSDRLIHKKSVSEEEIANKSGFLYRKPIAKRVRPNIDYRGLSYFTNYGTEQEEQEFIHMQGSASVALRLGPSTNPDKFIAVGEIGYAPRPRISVPKEESQFRSREHYLGYRFNSTWGVYAGLMDKVFGTRLPDHIAFSRSVANLAMNDQAHGLLVHMATEKIEAGVHYFLGNLAQDDNVRQSGFSTKVDYNISPKARVGFSYLLSSSTFLENNSYALHYKTAFGKGSSMLFEFGNITKTAVLRSSKTTSQYTLFQNHLILRRGLFFLTTFEFLNADTENSDKTLRVGPGIQFFPFQGVEVRTDLYNTRAFSTTSVSEDNWALTMQVHLWI